MTRLILALVALLIVACPAWAFQRQVAKRSSTSLSAEQTVKDLNLDEMFEVFEAADKKVPMPKAPVSTSRAKSLSVPFLRRPSACDGSMVGDKQFDPLGFSDFVDIKFLREAEIKHGRICMLAVVGWLGGGLAGPMATNPLEAHNAGVASGANAQVLTAIAALEFVGVVALQQTMSGGDRAPGDFGFDPLGLGKDPKKRATYQLNEVENARLAMLGFSGLVTAAAAFPDRAFPYL